MKKSLKRKKKKKESEEIAFSAFPFCAVMSFSTGWEAQTKRVARLERDEVTGGASVDCSLSLFLVKQFQQQNGDISSAFLKAARFLLPSIFESIPLSIIPPFLVTSSCTGFCFRFHLSLFLISAFSHVRFERRWCNAVGDYHKPQEKAKILR